VASKRPASFMSERSLEYVLVPEMLRILEPFCKNVVAIYFWKSREGGRLSARVHGEKHVRVAALFARRPKFAGSPPLAQGKVNRELIRFAYAAKSYGIPAIAGFCPATSLFDLKAESAFWLPISQLNPNEEAVFYENSDNKLILLGGSALTTISAASLPKFVLDETRNISFNFVAEAIASLHQELSAVPAPFCTFGPRYKPVYLLIEL
jgi:hypothetical protein